MNTRHALALALLLPLQAMAADQVNFTLSPSASVVDVGESFFLDLIGTYTGGSEIVGGAANLGFDSSVLEVLGITLRAPVDVAESARVIDNVAGSVTGIGFASFVGVKNTFTLATVEFKAKAAGSALLELTNANDDIYVWANGVGEEVSFSGALASVAVVPEPANWAMLLGGLGLTGFIARRRHSTRSLAR